jgi:general secretion pathway protein E
MGYRGQTGAYEIMVFDSDARKLIAAGDLNGLKTHMRRLKTISIQEAALRKAIDGVTSIEEVIRITRSGPASQGSGQGEAA